MVRKDNDIKKEVTLGSMERLAKVMNDSPSLLKLGKTEFAITALKPGTQWLIAEEAVKIQKKENESLGDVIKDFAVNIPSVVRVITLAILNDKKRIYSEEYQTVYDTIMWETKPEEWLNLLVEIIQMLSLDFFFQITQSVETVRQMALGRKMTMDERKSLQAVQNGGK